MAKRLTDRLYFGALRLLCIAILATCGLQAQPGTTSVIDVIYTPLLNVLFNGTLQISNPLMVGIPGNTIGQWSQTVQIVNGAVSLQLLPTDTATPPGTQYVFHYTPQLNNGNPWFTYCSIPTSATPITLSPYCSTTAGNTVSLNQLLPGTATPGQIPILNSSYKWVPGSAAVTTNGTNGQGLTSSGTGGFGTPVTLAPSATTDTTNASNISSGTLPAGREPAFTGDCTTSAGSVATTCTQLNGSNFTVSTAGLPTKIAGITTVGVGVPVVGWQSILTNSNMTSLYTLATAPSPGDYEIHFDLDMHTPCTTGTGQLTLAFGWTGNSARTLTTGPMQLTNIQGTGSFLSGVQPIHVASGNVTYTPTITVSCATGTPTWDGNVYLTRTN